MKTDIYTKTVLTVIAIALIVLVFKNGTVVNEAKAEKSTFSRYASIPLNEDGSINVKLVSFYGTLPINIKEYGGSSISSSGLPVNIESLNGSSVYSSLPVKETH